MDIESFRAHCLNLPFVEEYLPFDENTLAFRVGFAQGKIFALIGLDAFPLRVNLKCDPEKAIELRDKYSQVIPGYHMNKKHWNTVYLDDGLPEKKIIEMLHHSYELVYTSLPAKLKKELESI
ncbi:MAG: hypothetical protein RLZZ546_960 [Bacteroidota bacterium]